MRGAAVPDPLRGGSRFLKGLLRRAGERLLAQRTERLQGHIDAVAAETSRHGEALRRLESRERESAATQAGVVDSLRSLAAAVERVEGQVAELGRAIDRERGIEGAPAAYREAMYRLHEVRREVRDLPDRLHAEGSGRLVWADGGDAAPLQGMRAGSDPYAGKHPTRFDYVGFERRFRGDPEDIRELLVERYADALSQHAPVVDIGCGRGELLGALAERGVQVLGVEPNPELAAQARARGVEVVEATAGEYLSTVGPGSLGAVVSFHVVEHLVTDDLLELFEGAARALRPGGLFVAETPNPTTWLTLHESYLLDPTHVQPLHPALLGWMAEGAGFTRVEMRYHSPAESLRLPRLDDGEATGATGEDMRATFNALVDRLDHQLYGPQDYALWAWR